MADRSVLGPAMAHWRALAACIFVIIIPIVVAGWLNTLTVFAFPLGTFLVGLGVPVLLIVVAFTVPRAAENESFRP